MANFDGKKYEQFVGLFESPDQGHNVLMALGKQMQHSSDLAGRLGIQYKGTKEDIDDLEGLTGDEGGPLDDDGSIDMADFAALVGKSAGDEVTAAIAPLSEAVERLVGVLGGGDVGSGVTDLAVAAELGDDSPAPAGGEKSGDKAAGSAAGVDLDAVSEMIKELTDKVNGIESGMPALSSISGLRRSRGKSADRDGGYDDYGPDDGPESFVDPLVSEVFGVF